MSVHGRKAVGLLNCLTSVQTVTVHLSSFPKWPFYNDPVCAHLSRTLRLCCDDEQGLITYNNTIAVIDASVFHPSQLTEDRMLYFWISDEVLNPIMSAAHHDGRFVRNITGAELTVRTFGLVR